MTVNRFLLWIKYNGTNRPIYMNSDRWAAMISWLNHRELYDEPTAWRKYQHHGEPVC